MTIDELMGLGLIGSLFMTVLFGLVAAIYEWADDSGGAMRTASLFSALVFVVILWCVFNDVGSGV